MTSTRTRIFCLFSALLTTSMVSAAEKGPAATKPPAPVPAKSAAAVPPPEKKDGDKHADKKNGKKEKKPVVLARDLFSKASTGAALAPRSIGWYAKGCLSGGMHLEDTGPDWQAMRLSRNRAWGHPKLIKLVKRLAAEAKQDGWSGLLIGDISQPRGGPMLTGHASHQVGLDADIWLTPMPNRVLTRKEREDIQATSMLDKTSLSVDPKIFNATHVALIKRAASYPDVERIFVHPAIKKALCKAAGTDRAWLGKVRPLWGHHYHFHIRIGCPNGGCQAQPPVSGDDGCGAELTNWLKSIEASLKPKKPAPPDDKWIPPSERRRITMDQLPPECRVVLDSPGVNLAEEASSLPQTGSTKK